MSASAQPAAVAAAACALLGSAACERPQDSPPVLPSSEEVREIYAEHVGVDSVVISGNVVELHVRQPAEQLRRGGSLWARVGPYIAVFSPSSRDLFERYADVAAVRVITVGGFGDEVARAMLRRDALSDIQWRRSLNLLGHALREGTERPTRLEQLIEWGEQHTEYEYNERFLN
ncbi:MAG: hypothetical protein ACRELD_02280 [Longimicrobiales bacterium]